MAWRGGSRCADLSQWTHGHDARGGGDHRRIRPRDVHWLRGRRRGSPPCRLTDRDAPGELVCRAQPRPGRVDGFHGRRSLRGGRTFCSTSQRRTFAKSPSWPSPGLCSSSLSATANRRRAMTTDRAVELGPALASALDDPEFHFVVRASNNDGWLTSAGLLTAAPDSPRNLTETTSIIRDGLEIARITHDASTLADPAIGHAVTRAVELVAHNARLRADLEAQAESVASSRRRLLDAGLREREALGSRVQTEVLLPLLRLIVAARTMLTDGLPDSATERVQHAADALDVARTRSRTSREACTPGTGRRRPRKRPA